jgi:hypothetical protein
MTRTITAHQLSAPLGSADVGSLVFTQGVSHLTIGVDGSMEDLYRARFEGRVPEIEVGGGTVTVKYRPSLHPPVGELTLSGRLPWDIEAKWGMSHVMADLEGAELRGLKVSGGSSHVEARLSRPKQTIPVRIGGGASDIELIRPADVPVRVHFGGGVSKLTIDDFSLASAGGTRDWQSPDYDRAAGRYEIEIGAGASKVTVRS